jgi:hypothetical protein
MAVPRLRHCLPSIGAEGGMNLLHEHGLQPTPRPYLIAGGSGSYLDARRSGTLPRGRITSIAGEVPLMAFPRSVQVRRARSPSASAAGLVVFYGGFSLGFLTECEFPVSGSDRRRRGSSAARRPCRATSTASRAQVSPRFPPLVTLTMSVFEVGFGASLWGSDFDSRRLHGLRVIFGVNCAGHIGLSAAPGRAAASSVDSV